MSIGSLSSNTVSTATRGSADSSARAAGETAPATIADHVAANEEQEPVRSVSTTLGTLVDTYL